MSTRHDVNELASALREIYARNPGDAERAIGDFLKDRLAGLDPATKREAFAVLEEIFPLGGAGAPGGEAENLVSLLLGASVAPNDLGSPETLKRLGESLHIIFSTLNDLVSLINSSLGGSPLGDETIRHIIGSSLEGESRQQSIEDYLNQIRKAFLVAQQASKEAAHTIAGYILTELDPKTMDTPGKGFKIGPLKKAEAFETFEAKYQRVAKWLDSDRFQIDFLRQFEKSCRKSFT